MWEDWPKNILDFYYVDPETISILRLVINYAFLKVNSLFPINIPQLILPYQLDIMSKVDIPQIISNCESKTTSLLLSL